MMSGTGIKNMTVDMNVGLNILNNENPQFSSYLDFHFQQDCQQFPLDGNFQSINDVLQQHYNIHDVFICKICINFERAEDLDSYIIYTTMDGLISIHPDFIYSYNIGEVKAISCPHNQLNLKNFSKDVGHMCLRYLKKFNKKILKRKPFKTLGTQGNFRIPHFNLLCSQNRNDVLYFLRYESYIYLQASNIDNQGLNRSAFLVNMNYYQMKLSNPKKTLRKNLDK